LNDWLPSVGLKLAVGANRLISLVRRD